MRHTLSSLTRRYKGSWDQIPHNSVSWPKYKEAPYPPDWHEMSSRETQTSTPQYLGGSSMQWQKLPEGWRTNMPSKKGSLKKPLTTSSEQASWCNGLIQSTLLKKPHLGTKRIEANA